VELEIYNHTLASFLLHILIYSQLLNQLFLYKLFSKIYILDLSAYIFLHSSIGTSVNHRNILVLELGVQKRDSTTVGYPAVVYVGNLHGNEPVTTEILLNLVHHLLSSYSTDDRITKFLKVCGH
jgi:hypothetical protein